MNRLSSVRMCRERLCNLGGKINVLFGSVICTLIWHPQQVDAPPCYSLKAYGYDIYDRIGHKLSHNVIPCIVMRVIVMQKKNATRYNVYTTLIYWSAKSCRRKWLLWYSMLTRGRINRIIGSVSAYYYREFVFGLEKWRHWTISCGCYILVYLQHIVFENHKHLTLP